MKKLSVGIDSTLGNWLMLVSATFGTDSNPANYLREKIADEGEDQEVVADEGSFIYVLATMDESFKK